MNMSLKEPPELLVGLQSGEKYRGKIVGIDEETDVAVIKIETSQGCDRHSG